MLYVCFKNTLIVLCSSVYHKDWFFLVIALQCSEIYCSLQNIDDKLIKPVKFIGQSSAGMEDLVSYKFWFCRSRSCRYIFVALLATEYCFSSSGYNTMLFCRHSLQNVTSTMVFLFLYICKSLYRIIISWMYLSEWIYTWNYNVWNKKYFKSYQ